MRLVCYLKIAGVMRVRAGQHEDQQRRKFYRKVKKSFGTTL